MHMTALILSRNSSHVKISNISDHWYTIFSSGYCKSERLRFHVGVYVNNLYKNVVN